MHERTTLTEWLGIQVQPNYWHHSDIRFDSPWAYLILFCLILKAQ